MVKGSARVKEEKDVVGAPVRIAARKTSRQNHMPGRPRQYVNLHLPVRHAREYPPRPFRLEPLRDTRPSPPSPQRVSTMPPTFWSSAPPPPSAPANPPDPDMSVRISYGSRASDHDPPRRETAAGARQIQPPVSSLQQALNKIKADIDAGEEQAIPECVISEVSVAYDAVLELHRPNIGPYSEGGEHDLPANFKRAWTEDVSRASQTFPTATVDAITNIADRKPQAVVQRAASRGILAAMERMDGFKYSLNNAWSSKDADGQRFSYICQDSMQNKDRHANGFTRTMKHLKGEGERGPRKATYDCKGSVSIKCSMVRRSIDIFYRHYAIHSSVAERKALPRPPRAPQPATGKGSAGNQDGGLLGRLQSEKSAFATPPVPGSGSQGGSNIGRPLKRKRDEETPSKPDKSLSLVDLLRQSEAPEKPTTPVKPAPRSMHPPPMNYDLPSWQAPPPPPPQAKPPVQIPRAGQTTNGATPYPPPYQPQNHAETPQHHLQRQPSTSSQTPASSHNDSGYYSQTPSQSQSQPTNQALFSTLKPTPSAPPPTFYSGRTRSSCTNCRYGKKKCDGTRPVCNNCASVGKFDCAYDGAYGYPASAAQQVQMGGWAAVQSPVQMQTPVSSQGYGQQQYQQYHPPPPQPSQQHIHPPASAQASAPPASMSQYQQAPQHSQPQAGGPREESPDPWFPKR